MALLLFLTMQEWLMVLAILFLLEDPQTGRELDILPLLLLELMEVRLLGLLMAQPPPDPLVLKVDQLPIFRNYLSPSSRWRRGA